MTQHYCVPRHNPSTPSTLFGDATFFHLTLVSAEELQCSGRFIGRSIKVHAEIQQNGGAVKKTDTDGEGGKNPKWNFNARYPIADFMSEKGGKLMVRLYYKRSVGYTTIGEVEIDVSGLFDMWRDSRVAKACPVGGNNPHGNLNIRFDFSLR